MLDEKGSPLVGKVSKPSRLVSLNEHILHSKIIAFICCALFYNTYSTNTQWDLEWVVEDFEAAQCSSVARKQDLPPLV